MAPPGSVVVAVAVVVLMTSTTSSQYHECKTLPDVEPWGGVYDAGAI
jgi:hypothetical protein